MDGPLEIMIHTKITQQKAGAVPHGCVMRMNIHLRFLNKITGPKDLCNTTESQKLLSYWWFGCFVPDGGHHGNYVKRFPLPN